MKMTYHQFSLNLTVNLIIFVLSVSEVSNAIQNLNKNKATGPDEVHNRLLIAAVSIITEPLTKLFNRSLNESRVPAIGKVAHITTLHEKRTQRAL